MVVLLWMTQKSLPVEPFNVLTLLLVKWSMVLKLTAGKVKNDMIYTAGKANGIIRNNCKVNDMILTSGKAKNDMILIVGKVK